jgi:hypothetical protein
MNPKIPGSYSRTLSAFLTAMLLLAVPLLLTGAAQAPIQLVKISNDIFKNTDMQHATEVEPDTYSFGSTIVSAFQVGRRYANGGSSDLGFAISTDGGTTWKHGFLPGLTTHYKGGKFPAVSDPSVSYDSKHGVWLVSSLGISDANSNTVLLSSNSADGINWNDPVTADNTSGYGDKDWLVCDNGSSSRFLGHCYIEWDDAGGGGQVRMTTSGDGGKTWSHPFNVPNAGGLGGQPVVRPDGTVVVPFSGNGIQAFTSTNGGKTWNSPVTITNVDDHFVAGGLRTSVLPSAEVDAAGTVYVVWQDCRFRSGCSSNDVVMSTSTNGKNWSTVSRIPIDPVASTVDHFIPSIAVDTSTSGSSAHLGITYYYYPVANCTQSTCNLSVGFVSSKDGGKTWTQGKKLAGGMKTTWLPNTTLGFMVGDYISTSYVNGKAFGVFAKALTPTGSTFHESMYTPAVGLIAEDENGPFFSSAGERPVPNAKSDHGPRKFYDTEGLFPIPPSKQIPPSE